MTKELKVCVFDKGATSYAFTASSWLSQFTGLGAKFRTELNPLEKADLMIGPLDWVCNNAYRLHDESFIYTSNESTRYPYSAVGVLKDIKGLIVPSTWNASCFSAQGVNIPIHVCQLGHDIDHPGANSLSKNLPVKFATVASVNGLPGRKNLLELLEAFVACDFGERAELYVRTDLGQTMRDAYAGKGIVFMPNMPRDVYHSWIKQMHVGVFVPRGEGFCLPVLEFQAAGRLTIIPNIPPLNEFAFIHPTLTVKHVITKVQEDDFYGNWFGYNFDDICDAMTRVVDDADVYNLLVQRTIIQVKHLTWRNSAANLLEILKNG